MRQRQTRVGADHAETESGHSFIILKHFYYFATFLFFCNIFILLQHFYTFPTLLWHQKYFDHHVKVIFWKVITSLALMVYFFNYPIGLGVGGRGGGSEIWNNGLRGAGG
jgi:hypothetical protein